MRIFLISDEDRPVSLVYHNYVDGSYYCRSKVESFVKSFNMVCGRMLGRFIKKGGRLKIVNHNRNDYGWIDSILGEACTGIWQYKELKTDLDKKTFDDLVLKYLT